MSLFTESQNHRITESQNGKGWKGPLWIIFVGKHFNDEALKKILLLPWWNCSWSS